MRNFPITSTRRSATWAAALCVALAGARPATAAEIPAEVQAKVEKATVLVLMGEAVPGKAQHKWLQSGSGCFINSSGLVVTNNHVVDLGHGKHPSEKFELRSKHSEPQYAVVLDPGTDQEELLEARVQYQSESADLALLQVQSKPGSTPAPYLNLAPSIELRTGDSLWCFGFPGGRQKSTRKDRHAKVSIAQGNIIGLPRSPGGRLPYIDTDVITAAGASGGPLVNQTGALIGVLSQGAPDQAAGSGIKVRIIPAELVADMVKVADGLSKLQSACDLKPLEEFESRRGSATADFGLAKRLTIADSNLREIAALLDQADVGAAGKEIDARLTKSKLRGRPKPWQDRARTLQAECLLQQGQYAEALRAFKKLRRSNVEHVEWYAKSRTHLLKKHAGGQYQGEPLSEPAVFRNAASEEAAALIFEARDTVQSYRDVSFKDNRQWRKLDKKLKEHEDMLRLASCLKPGRGENDVFRSWRFRQQLNIKEARRLSDQAEALNRKLRDFELNRGRLTIAQHNQMADGLNAKIAKFEKQKEQVSRELADTFRILWTGGFRLDDLAATPYLD